MCLAIPGKVVEKFVTDGVEMGTIDFDGIRKTVCLSYVPDIKIGEYALIHVGFAIEKLDEKTALETLEMFRELGVLEDELCAEEEVQGVQNEISARVS